jgi:putative transposase
VKALTIRHAEVTRETLLRLAEEIRGAWIGIRIAAYLLILSGWTSSQVAEMFGLTRCAVVKWVRKANQLGLEAVRDMPRPGRPARIDEGVMMELDHVLSCPPKEAGISRARWDGVVVVEYLSRTHGIRIHVRHAQRLMRKLGYSLHRTVHRYVQATQDGVDGFRKELKKTPAGQDKSRKTSDPL